MEILFGLGIAVFLIGSIIKPWVHGGSIRDLEYEVKKLKEQLLEITSYLQSHGMEVPKQAPSVKEAHADITAFLASVPPVKIPEPSKPQPAAAVIPPPVTVRIERKEAPKKRISFEQQFGARLPVWVGGIALALAGFYLVKYSIEVGLLTPAMRTFIGGIFGLGLMAAAHWIGARPIANSGRIAQSLAGAAIADLYIVLFAATSLYHLLPPVVGFIGMAMVTATAVVLSLRHGAPIALMGLVGGFLTPALVSSNEPNAPLLFIYLYFVLTGLFVVIRKRHWWALSIPAVVGAFLWVAIWMVHSFTPTDSIWLGLFLMAVSATVVVQSRQVYEDDKTDIDEFTVPKALNYLTLGGSTLLMGAVAAKAGFGTLEWGLFGLISAGGIALAYFNQKLYGFVPWVSMAVNIVMLMSWKGMAPDTLAFAIAAFGALYAMSGYALMWRASKPLPWAGLAASASLGYYLLGYYRLQMQYGMYGLIEPGHWLENMPVWGIIALALALLAVHATSRLLNFAGDAATKQRLLAVFVVMATTFLSLALTIELQREFLSVAFAAQVLALAWINTKVDIRALRNIMGVLAGIFAFLLAPQILLLIQLTAYSLAETQLYLQRGVPIVNWPLFQLGLPAVMFAGASVLLRKQADGKLVRSFEAAAIALIAVMGYYLTRHVFHIDENVLFVKAGFAERGVITNILFIYGLACFWVGRRFGRSAVSLSAVVLSGVAVFRITYFDLFIYNPVWSHQLIGATPIFNLLLLPYALPILWLLVAMRELQSTGYDKLARYTAGFLLALVFAFVSFTVRQFYHGEYLDVGIVSNAEIYSYSVAWLLVGLGLLFYGTLKQDKAMRVASLVVMIFTVGKVFLYDASELEGLFRVFSFLGLGVSLLALSWFYTRFVFNRSED